MNSMSVLSTDYDRWSVKALVNPTIDVVQFAYLTSPVAVPGNTDWLTGSWEPTALLDGAYVARCLIGPLNGGNVLAAGTYYVWIKIIDNPAVPVQFVGILRVV